MSEYFYKGTKRFSTLKAVVIAHCSHTKLFPKDVTVLQSNLSVESLVFLFALFLNINGMEQ